MNSPDQGTVVVLMGGPGSEAALSRASGRAVADALRSAARWEVAELDIDSREFSLPPGTSLVVNLIHGTFGEDGELQRLLDARGIAYTGAGAESSRLAFDKVESKARFLSAGVPTPEFEIWDPAADRPPNMHPPLAAKPAREGSSVGVHLVRDEAGLAAAREDLQRFSSPILVETLIEGRELTVGILDGEALPVIEIRPRSGFYDMRNKYPWLMNEGGTDYICPAELPPAVTAAVQDAARRAHEALGVEVYSRVDVLLDRDERPWVLEVNTIPGMTESSLLPKAASAAGIGFEELCRRICELSAAVRHP